MRNTLTHEVLFVSKGAEAVMLPLLASASAEGDGKSQPASGSSSSSSAYSGSAPEPATPVESGSGGPSAEWLDEELSTLARSGLRTLVYAYRRIGAASADALVARLNAAMAALKERESAVAAARAGFERNLVVLGATAVEDALQFNVRQALETIRNASIKVWMLTGDKAETAANVAVSSRLCDRDQIIFQLICSTKRELLTKLQAFSAMVRFRIACYPT